MSEQLMQLIENYVEARHKHGAPEFNSITAHQRDLVREALSTHHAAPGAPQQEAAFDGFLCRAWGETDLPCAKVVRDLQGIRSFFEREWWGGPDPDAAEVMTDIEGHDWKEQPLWAAEFEIGGVSVELVYSFASRAAATAPTTSQFDKLAEEVKDSPEVVEGRKWVASVMPATAPADLDALLTKVLNSRVGVEQELFDMAAGKKPMPDAAKLRELAVRLGDPKARTEATAPAGEDFEAVWARLPIPGEYDAYDAIDQRNWKEVVRMAFERGQSAAPAGGVTDLQKTFAEAMQVLDFLAGTGELEGCGFSGKPAGLRGPYWWRPHLTKIRAALQAARAAEPEDVNLEKDAALWREHASKLDALVSYCPTCCTGFTAKPEMTRDEVIFECGKTAGAANAALQARAAEPDAYRVFKDGNQWCAVGPAFTNLQESPAGFADTPYLALERLTEAEAEEKRKAWRAASPTPPTTKDGGQES